MSGYRENAKLTAYALGELGTREARGVERDVANEPEAREAVDEVLEVASLLKDEFESEPELFLTAEQRAALLRGEKAGAAVPVEDDEDDAVRVAGADAGGAGRRVWVRRDGVADVKRGWFLAGLGTAAAAMLAVAFLQVAVPDREELAAAEAASGAGAAALEVTVGVVPEMVPGSGLYETEPRTTSPLWTAVEAVESAVIEYEVPGEPEAAVEEVRENTARAVAMTDLVVETVVGRPSLVALPGSVEPYAFLAPGIRSAGAWESEPRFWTEAGRLIPSAGEAAKMGEREAGLIPEGGFLSPLGEPVSSIPMSFDPAAYANLRHFVLEYNVLPPAGLVSLGDLVNYFDYGYAAPKTSSGDALRASVEVAECPWAPERLLVRVGMKAREAAQRGGRNVVLILDTSKSMLQSTKMPVLQGSVDALLDSLGESGRVAVIPFGGEFAFTLGPTSAADRNRVKGAVAALASGVGNADRGLSLAEASDLARRAFSRDGGLDEVVVITDSLAPRAGAPGVVASELAALGKLTRSHVSVIGLGTAILEEGSLIDEVSEKGTFYHAGTVVAGRRAFDRIARGDGGAIVARGVEAEVEFNPQTVRAYRLLANVGDKGANASGVVMRSGQEVTALYEVIPMGGSSVVLASAERPLKYGPSSEELRELAAAGSSGAERRELLTLRMAYQNVDARGKRGKAQHLEVAVGGQPKKLAAASDDFRFAASVAGFGILVSGYGHAGEVDFRSLWRLAEGATADATADPFGMRAEFMELLQATLGAAEGR